MYSSSDPEIFVVGKREDDESRNVGTSEHQHAWSSSLDSQTPDSADVKRRDEVNRTCAVLRRDAAGVLLLKSVRHIQVALRS
ncbi:hypothetical protein GQ600_7861 [Phytophthora cactorum]|nr:hypothetical protein GQ600_7861 [Phytophthora cactorum]